MSDERLHHLLQKALSANASPQELEELANAVKADESGAAAVAIDEGLRQDMGALPAYDQQKWQAIATQILDADKRSVPSRERQSTLRWLTYNKGWWAAAAVLFVLLTAVSFWLMNEPKKPANTEVVKTLPKNDVAPGKAGAVLTLADGSKVMLDSAGNGVIALQGNTSVTLKDGQVSYDENNKSAAVVYNTMSTPKGRQYQLVLADGSRVWLNAGSSITFPTAFTGDERRVSITGEAYFEISHVEHKGKRIPFYVELPGHALSAERTVEVLGTHFNVNAYEEEATINTTLLEGSVRVKSGGRQQLITSGEQAQLNKAANEIQVDKSVDLEQVVAWKEGYFNFDNTDIKVVLRQLERWYDIDVVFEGAAPAHLIYGKMQRELYLSQVLNILKKLNVNYRLEGRKLVILP
jgi:transmembrane sensor